MYSYVKRWYGTNALVCVPTFLVAVDSNQTPTGLQYSSVEKLQVWSYSLCQCCFKGCRWRLELRGILLGLHFSRITSKELVNQSFSTATSLRNRSAMCMQVWLTVSVTTVPEFAYVICSSLFLLFTWPHLLWPNVFQHDINVPIASYEIWSCGEWPISRVVCVGDVPGDFTWCTAAVFRHSFRCLFSVHLEWKCKNCGLPLSPLPDFSVLGHYSIYVLAYVHTCCCK